VTRLPWWAAVVAVWLAARLVSVVLLLVVARSQAANGWTGTAPGYFEYTGLMWDASWYRQIAELGYPDTLPVGADGRVQQNALAFFPLFPMLVRGLMALTGGPWHVVAPLTALVLGTAAALVLHQVVARAVAGPGAATMPGRVRAALPLTTVALLGTSASAPVLQVGYTESLALLGVVVVIHALQRERYALAALAIGAVGLTRAVALPLALVVLAHGWSRLRSGEPFRVPARWAVGALAAWAAASGLAWPWLVGRMTGVPDAYTLTQGAWRARGEVVWFVPWLDIARWLFGGWGVVVLALVAAALVAALASRAMRRLGPELHAWAVGYVGYLVAVLEPGTSLVRFAILAFPFWAALAQPALASRRPRVAVGALVLLGLVGQAAWLSLLWRLVPPSGWPP
jgi:hypothetical protein